MYPRTYVYTRMQLNDPILIYVIRGRQGHAIHRIAIWPERFNMIQGFGPGGAITPLESVRAVLGLQQDIVIREDKCNHFFTPDRVRFLMGMGPGYYIRGRYIHIAPMIIDGDTPGARPVTIWYTRPECEIRFRVRQIPRVFTVGLVEWIREVQFSDPTLGESPWHGGPMAWKWESEEGLTINFRYHGAQPYPHKLKEHFSSDRVTAEHGRCCRQKTSSFWWGQKEEQGFTHYIAVADATYGREAGPVALAVLAPGAPDPPLPSNPRPPNLPTGHEDVPPLPPGHEARSSDDHGIGSHNPQSPGGGRIETRWSTPRDSHTPDRSRANPHACDTSTPIMSQSPYGASSHAWHGDDDARMSDDSDKEYLDDDVVSF